MTAFLRGDFLAVTVQVYQVPPDRTDVLVGAAELFCEQPVRTQLAASPRMALRTQEALRYGLLSGRGKMAPTLSAPRSTCLGSWLLDTL